MKVNFTQIQRYNDIDKKFIFEFHFNPLFLGRHYADRSRSYEKDKRYKSAQKAEQTE